VTSEETQTDADRALKAKHRAMWAFGDYPALASDLISPLGPVLVEAAGVQPGDRVLDVAAGSGNVAIPAALAGATVVASDLTPELLQAGERQAQQRGATLEWVEADAEALPFANGEFDTVLSCVGVMFAPHHQATADETIRVLRDGGTLGLINWTPEGYIGQLFATMKPFAPPPPPGSSPGPLWGNEDHIRELFGDRLSDLDMRRQKVAIEHFSRPEEFRDYFKSHYGPTIAVYNSLADDPEREAELDRELVELARRGGLDGGDGRLEWEYLLVTARKR
jgi:SAM-dependent methyltransferase